MEIGPAGAGLATKPSVALVDEVRSLWDFDADLAAEAGELQHSQCHISRAARLVEAVRFPHSYVSSSAAPDERSSVYPDAPTLREQGEDVTSVGWYGCMASAATPDPIVERMQSEVGQALSDTDIKQKLAVQGLDVHYLPGPEFGKFIDSESEKWGKIIRDAGINKQ